MTDLLFKNARVIDPSQNLNRICDVLCKDGVITQIGENITCGNAVEIDAVSYTHLRAHET